MSKTSSRYIAVRGGYDNHRWLYDGAARTDARPGDSVTIENLVFRILEMTGPRVKKVRIRRNAALAPSNSPESAHRRGRSVSKVYQ